MNLAADDAEAVAASVATLDRASGGVLCLHLPAVPTSCSADANIKADICRSSSCSSPLQNSQPSL
jgi:hypothetical protein